MPSGRAVVRGEPVQPQVSGSLVGDKISSHGIDDIHYYITTSREKFEFRKAFDKFGASGEQTCEAVALPTHESADYHAHLGIGITKEEINIHLWYLEAEGNPHEHAAKDVLREVGAEHLMEWLGGFFKHDTCQVHIHAHYLFPAASRLSKFPLPLRTSLEGAAEINGISLRLPKEPEGVSRIRLTQGKDYWFVEVIADRRIAFNKFDVQSDVRALVSVIDLFMEKRLP